MKKLLIVLLPLFLFSDIVDYINRYSEESYKEFKSGKDTINWWRNLWGDIKLSEDEVRAINEYTFGHYQKLNQDLRSGKPLSSLSQEEQKKVSILDKALSKTIVFENLIVYRYERLDFFNRLYPKKFLQEIYQNGKFTERARHLLETMSHKIYKDYGFMSTTMIRNSVFQTRPVELIIKVPKYADALFVSLPEFATFETQYELLFPRDVLLQVEFYHFSEDLKTISIVMKMIGPCYKDEECRAYKEDNIKQTQ